MRVQTQQTHLTQSLRSLLRPFGDGLGSIYVAGLWRDGQRRRRASSRPQAGIYMYSEPGGPLLAHRRLEVTDALRRRGSRLQVRRISPRPQTSPGAVTGETQQHATRHHSRDAWSGGGFLHFGGDPRARASWKASVHRSNRSQLRPILTSSLRSALASACGVAGLTHVHWLLEVAVVRRQADQALDPAPSRPFADRCTCPHP